jgi:hypothetical protein
MVGLTRLFLPDLSDEDLQFLDEAVKVHPDPEVSLTGWIDILTAGHMGMYRIEGEGARGLLGLIKRPDHIFIEFICGRGLMKIAQEIVPAIKALPEAKNFQRLECMVSHPALAELYEKCGWKRMAVWMRHD